MNKSNEELPIDRELKQYVGDEAVINYYNHYNKINKVIDQNKMTKIKGKNINIDILRIGIHNDADKIDRKIIITSKIRYN